MADPIPRWKDYDDYSPQEHLERQQANREGKPEPRFERDEYRERRNKVLAREGLVDDREDA